MSHVRESIIIHYFSEKLKMPNFRKIGVGCLSVLGVLMIGLVIAYFVMSESKPEGKTGPEADRLAEQMLTAINKPAWDSLRYISWDFSGRNQYAWDKEKEIAIITSGDSEVVMDLKAVDGIAKNGGTVLTGEAKNAAIGKAWSNWCRS